MLCLNYTNKKTKKNINEALKIIRRGTDNWEQYGWTFYGDGTSKTAFIKGLVVVKFGPYNQIQDEYLRWVKFRGNKLRKYLARVYGVFSSSDFTSLAYNEGVLIQRRVRGIREYECFCKKAKKISSKIDFTIDYSINHGHDKYGNPIFFDTDIF